MASGVGAMLGCFISGFMTQYFHPKYSFLLYSMMGLVIAANGLFLTQESEADSQEASREISQLSLGNSTGEEASGFWGKLGKNLR